MLLRRLLSIFLLLVLGFNIVGYRAWFYYAEKDADAAMEARLDKEQYNVNELVSFSIPLNNPYLLEQNNFERVTGEINIQGKNFRLVKRKVSDGNLILLCLPDTHKMVLKKAKTEYGNAANDMTNTGKGNSRSGLQKSFNGPDYISQFANTQLCRSAEIKTLYGEFQMIPFTDPLIAAIGKPPETTMA